MGRRLAVLTAIALCIGWSGPALSNTLKAMKVDRQDIVEFVDDLYPGIVRIIELQERGYVYLRP